jgi:hypothetical protein
MSLEARIVPRSRDEFMAALAVFHKGTNDGFVDVYLEQAALMCRDSMVLTPPIVKAGGGGMTDDARMVGNAAIKGDVHSVVVGQRSGSVNGRRGRLFRKLGTASFMNNPAKFWKLAGDNTDLFSGNALYARMFNKGFGTEKSFNKLKNYFNRIGQQEAGNAMNRSVIDSVEGVKRVHMAALKRFGGRIRKNGGPGIQFWERMEAKDKVLKDYIRERQKTVGKVKAGWVDTLAKLPKPKSLGGSRNNAGRSKIPVWIKRHQQSNGYVTMTHQQAETMALNLVLGNRNGDADYVATDADVKNLVYGNRVKQMPAQLEAMLKARAEKFNRKK